MVQCCNDICKYHLSWPRTLKRVPALLRVCSLSPHKWWQCTAPQAVLSIGQIHTNVTTEIAEGWQGCMTYNRQGNSVILQKGERCHPTPRALSRCPLTVCTLAASMTGEEIALWYTALSCRKHGILIKWVRDKNKNVNKHVGEPFQT